MTVFNVYPSISYTAYPLYQSAKVLAFHQSAVDDLCIFILYIYIYIIYIFIYIILALLLIHLKTFLALSDSLSGSICDWTRVLNLCLCHTMGEKKNMGLYLSDRTIAFKWMLLNEWCYMSEDVQLASMFAVASYTNTVLMLSLQPIFLPLDLKSNLLLHGLCNLVISLAFLFLWAHLALVFLTDT